ncbi:hypothetical protein AAVH_09318 [Aphelenchoides avenae]|nr:hypothetical protein AAVH_09318 [Aphelenchus avenae]
MDYFVSVTVALVMFFGANTMFALDYCILYRLAAVLQNNRYRQFMISTAGKLLAGLLMTALSMAVAVIGHSIVSVEEVTPENQPSLRDYMAPGSDAFACVASSKANLLPICALIALLVFLAEATCCGIGIATLRYIKQSYSLSRKSQGMHGQLMLLLLIQMSTPMICVVLPMVATLCGLVLGFEITDVGMKAGCTFLSLFPLINAILTCVARDAPFVYLFH